MRRPVQRDGESDAAYADRLERHLESNRRAGRKWRNANLEAERADTRERMQRSRALPAGHPGTCDVCGVRPPPRKNGRRGLCEDHRHDNNVIRGWLCNRCNSMVGAFDLRYTDPDLYRALMAWSARGESPIVVVSKAPKRRRKAKQHPALFPQTG